MIESRADWAMLNSSENVANLKQKVEHAKSFSSSQFAQDVLAMDVKFLLQSYSEKDINDGCALLEGDAMAAVNNLHEWVQRLKAMQLKSRPSRTQLAK